MITPLVSHRLFIFSISPPALIIFRINGGYFSKAYFSFRVIFFMLPLTVSTETMSPFLILSDASGDSIIGRPMLILFLENILAKLSAITQETPAALIAMGACSLDEPQPKFFPATMISPGLTFFAKRGSASSMQWLARSE